MVTTVRSQYKHNVEKTNMGLIISPQIKSTYPAKTSIKVIVRYDRCLTKENMVTFTCDVSTSVVHIIFTVIAELPGTYSRVQKSIENFVFRPKMSIFQRAGMRKEGLPLPLAFQYLILMI